VAVAGREDDDDPVGDGGGDRGRHRWFAADSGPLTMLEPQLLVMMCGSSPIAALKAPIVLTNDILTIRKSTSGAVANTFADSEVP
jgi:hypothetical protein